MNIRGLHDDKGIDHNDDDKKTTNSFAGGEKSGLAIENPMDSPWGAAISAGDSPPPGSRKVTIYKNGFRIDGGEFRSLDDPNNTKFIEDVKSGYAPKELREGAMGPVHLIVDDRRSESYEPPAPPKYTLFTGEGARLSGASSSTKQSVTVDTHAATVQIESDSPKTTLQFRFHDGTRTTQEFNHHHTIGDLHIFVMQCAPVDSSYTLLAGFPPKPIDTNSSLTLKDAGLLNASLTQKIL